MFNYKTGEGEADSEKYREKKEKIGQLSSLGPGLYWFWQLINIGAEVRTTMSTWVWHGLKHCWGLCLGDRESPHVASKIPTAFIWPKAKEKVLTCTYYGIQALEVFYWTAAGKVTVFHGCCTVAVKNTQASFYLSFLFSFFFFFITSSTIALKLVGRQKPSRLHLTGSETNFRIVAKVTGEQIWSHLD